MGTPSSGLSTRSIGAVMGAVFLVAAVRVYMVWDRLPPVMASHFGASGIPDRWMPRGSFFAMLAAIKIGLPLVFLFSGSWLRLIPTNLINMPNRDYWLTPERKDESMRKLGSFMAWYGLMLAVFMGFVLELTIRSNLHRAPLNSIAMFVGLACLFAVSIAMIVRMYRQFRLPGA